MKRNLVLFPLVFAFAILSFAVSCMAAAPSVDFASSSGFYAPKGFSKHYPPTASLPSPTPQDDWIKLDLSYATYLSPMDPQRIIITRLQENLDKYMPGKVKITIYAGGTLLAQSDIYDGILAGTADMGFVDLGVVANRFPLSQIFTYPSIVFNAPIVASQAMQEWVESTKPAEYDNVVFLQSQGNGAPCFFTKQKISKLSDLKGKQIRATSVLAKTVETFGAVPVTMETSEVYEAMRSGLVDGMYNNFGAAAFLNLEEVGGFALITPLGSISYAHVMNKDVFNSMPKSQQEAFMRANNEAFVENLLWQENTYLTERTRTCAGKVDLVFLEGAPLEEFKKACASLLDDYVKKLDTQGLDGTGQMKKIQEIADKYNAEFSWENYKSYYPPYANLEPMK
jgi:TRAP-type C4-dicarboxylate transport system substrate-binding protein